jgi:hypothetical protein
MEIEKVYCKNCKWKGGFFDYDSPYCDCKNGIVLNRYTGIKDEDSPSFKRKNELNNNGQCSFYEMIWYKFWIRNNK